MCNVCCYEFKGWCKSFTRTELVLTLLQALLFVVLLGFLLFLTLHLLVCSTEQAKQVADSPEHTSKRPQQSHIIYPPTPPVNTSVVPRPTTTLSPDIECTWQSSKKTKAPKRYYWSLPDWDDSATADSFNADAMYTTDNLVRPFKAYDDEESEENQDEEDAPEAYKNYVAALVKFKPPAELIYGCILTKVTAHWTLTAASCIESIKVVEVGSLDSFFIIERYGEANQGPSHALTDVQIHPLYQGANRSYDLAALRSDDALAPAAAALLRLPTMLEYFVVALGERFTMLGYGGYRSERRSAEVRRLRRAAAYSLSAAQCAGALGAAAQCAGALGAAAQCAGAPVARGSPCSYCAGTPLLRAGRLFGVMSDNRRCGITCAPTLFVNVAALRDWVESVVD